LIDRMNRRLGYRLQLTEASWPENIKAGEELVFSYTLRNAGAAPCLPGGNPVITLKNGTGGLVTTERNDTWDVRDLVTGPPGGAETREGTINLRVPADPAVGTYDIYFSVECPEHKTVLSLPLQEDDGERKYRLGSLTIS
jgi:hypothetical protein